MNKTLIAGLAGTSIVLAITLAYILGGQQSAIQSNFAALGQPEWATTMMGNRQANNRFSQDLNNQSMNAMHQQMHSNTSNLSTSLDATDYDLATMEAMLQTVIADEYNARAFYISMVEQYGETSPWSQLIQAETHHIDSLTALFNTYGLTVPADTTDKNVTTASLSEAYTIGITAEVNDIALYESYLATDLPDQVEAVFTNFVNASNRHLNTLEAYASGQTPTTHQNMMGRQGRWGY